MAMDIGAKSGVRSDINITPLVDVVLVLVDVVPPALLVVEVLSVW